MLEKQLLTTLRLHSSPITSIEPFYLPSPLTYSITNNSNNIYSNDITIFNPTLLTADESGLIIWWNLTTRRPLGIWQAHNDSVISMKQLGVEWVSTIEGYNIPKLNNLYGSLLTHSKDGSVKIWKMIDFLNDSKSEFVYTSVLRKKIDDDKNNNTPLKLFELPVNTLNYANIDMNLQSILLTPATIDSEGFDIYQIDLSQQEEYKKLKRIIQNYKYEKKMDDFDEDDVDITKRAGTGVIMKIRWIDDKTFIIGYENGNMVIYKIKEMNKITKVYEDASLSGNPITSIIVDYKNNKILWTSTGSKVCILDRTLNKPSIIFETKHKGINDINLDSYSNTVGLITWDGYSRIYQYDDDTGLKFNFKIRRQIPTVLNSNEQGDNNENSVQTQRASILKFTKRQVNPSSNNSLFKINYSNGRFKNIVKRNREEIYSQRWMFIGYQDGKVSVYLVTN